MDLYVKGKNRKITLTQRDFKASGGQADVFVQGGVAYKIYHDPAGMIPVGKIQELAPLALPTIIKPEDVLLDARHRPVGYPMRSVENAVPLIQTFTKAFRDREGLTPDKVLPLVASLRDGVQHVHDAGILIVDLNELNFLVDAHFKALYFIDVDSYQTPHFPAQFLMESVRDRHAKSHRWNAGTDWFSFAIVSFQMFTGIHPYKGKHPTVKDFEERFERNLSVLNQDVSVPAAALPFHVIPDNYRRWYEAVLERGQRLAPPAGLIDAVVVPVTLRRQQGGGSGLFEIVEWGAYRPGEVVRFVDGFVLTTEGVYEGRKRLSGLPAAGCELAITPRMNHAVLAWLDGRQVRLKDATTGQDIPFMLHAEALMSSGGRLFAKRGTFLEEIEMAELGGRVVPHARHVGNVAEQATQLFEGVALQNLLGATYASFFPDRLSCQQVRVPELDGYRVLDARAQGRVLMAAAEKAGKIDQFIFRFSTDWAEHDVRKLGDTTYSGINFALLDTGVVAHVNPNETMEMFFSQANHPLLKEIDDPEVKGDVRLFAHGAQTLFARGDKLYRIALKKP